jgi:hypothetical protein
MARPFITFRSREEIAAVYFDGSRESALEVLDAFPHHVQMELDGGGKPLLRISSQAIILGADKWLYKNGDHGRIEVRDHEELTKRWEQLGTDIPKAPSGKSRRKAK